MIICLGPVGSGKTLLLKKLQNSETIDDTTTTVPTVGTNIFNVKIDEKNFTIRELGGSMAPLWSMYFGGIDKVIYVVDASNLCQISAAGVLLYNILVNPLLQDAKVFLIFLIGIAISITEGEPQLGGPPGNFGNQGGLGNLGGLGNPGGLDNQGGLFGAGSGGFQSTGNLGGGAPGGPGPGAFGLGNFGATF